MLAILPRDAKYSKHCRRQSVRGNKSQLALNPIVVIDLAADRGRLPVP
jgi:hypothetical protein